MKKTGPEIHELKKQIEERLKRKMKTPSDFIFLSGVIWERTHETMSPTTLKRLWGYIDGADETRSSTLDILSRSLGYQDWENFLRQINKNNGSDPVLSQHISADDLAVGERIYVSWKPDRRCTFRYLGEDSTPPSSSCTNPSTSTISCKATSHPSPLSSATGTGCVNWNA